MNYPKQPTRSLSDLLFWLLFIGAFLVRVHFILTTAPDTLLVWLEDDSYYYLTPAWNFVQLGFFSGDGIHETYGFQPLWMILLTITASLCPDRVVFLRAAMLLALALFLIAGIGFRAFLGRYVHRTIGSFGLLLLWFANPYALDVYTHTKESGLHACFLGLLLLATQRITTKATLRVNWVFFGTVAGLLILSRINGLIAVFVATVLIYKGSICPRPRHLLIAIGTCALVISPWAFYAFRAFGTIIPTSAITKLFRLSQPGAVDEIIQAIANISYFGLRVFLDPLGFVHTYYGLKRYLVLIVGIIVLLWPYRKRISLRLAELRRYFLIIVQNIRQPRNQPLLLLSIYALVNYVTTLVFLAPWFEYGYWYHIPEYLFSTVILIILADYLVGRSSGLHLGGSRNNLSLGSLSLVSIFIVLTLYRGTSAWHTIAANRVEQHPSLSAVTWIKDNIPKQTRIGAWQSGLLGYLLDDYHVINLDGLANNLEFIQSSLIGNEPLPVYIEKEGIHYIVDVAASDEVERKDQLLFGFLPHDNLRFQAAKTCSYGPGLTELRYIVVKTGGSG